MTTQERILKVINQVLNEEYKEVTDIQALGLDSLDTADLQFRLEQEFKVTLRDKDFTDAWPSVHTLDDLARLINGCVGRKT